MKLIKMFSVLLTAIFTVFPVAAADMKSQAAEKTGCPRYFAGTIEINSTQMAFIISGQAGGGILEYAGEEHEFGISGLGIGGIGVQKINAIGVVYNLEKLGDFNGTYVQGRMGIAVGAGKGQMELSNSKCVVIELKSSLSGVALSLGLDGMGIKLK